MDKNFLIRETLLKFFPNECEMVGDSNLDYIASGSIEVIKTQGGANFDLTPIFYALINWSTLISNFITAYGFLKTKKETSPSVSQINIEITNNISIDNNISTEQKIEVFEHLLAELSKIKALEDKSQ
jgi:hypothetical protein